VWALAIVDAIVDAIVGGCQTGLGVNHMSRTGFRLGIDFGTSHTVAVLRWPDGRAKPLLFDGSPLLPSAVYVDAAGRFAVGRDAAHSARMDPGGYEPNPKRRVDDGSVLLGGREVTSVDLIGTVLRLVAEEATRTAGERPAAVTITYPAAWGTPRRLVLAAAADRAGLGKVRMVEEPVAAATYFGQVLGHRIGVGGAVVVYDFGGGTFDVSLVERTADGFRTIAVDGRDDIGGLDLDEALIRRIGQVYGEQDPIAWHRLAEPATMQERRQRRLFLDDVRAAKERLSRHPTAELYVPGLDRDAHLTRDEFEQVARPLLDETVRLTERVVRESGLDRGRISGVFLVGGSSRIPLVSTLVHRALQIAPTAIEQPELVVAEGSILVRSIAASVRAPVPASVSPASVSRVPVIAAAPVSPAAVSPAPVSPAPVSPAPVSAAPVPPALPVAATVPTPPLSAPAPRPRSASTLGYLLESGTQVTRVDSPTSIGGATSAPVRPEPMPIRQQSKAAPAPKRTGRWVLAGTVFAVLAALVASLALLPDRHHKGGGSHKKTMPLACTAAAPATPVAPLATGSPPPPSYQVSDPWQALADDTGFLLAVPADWTKTPSPSNVCYSDPHGGRFLAVGQWTQPDDDMAGYVARKERQLAPTLPGYQKVKIAPTDYFDAAVEWEFTYTAKGGDKMRARTVALVAPGHRGYAILWCTYDSIWQNNLTDYSLVLGGFRPAQ
jgi:actin-like ATPase involved in cell morphogenesis